MSVFFDLQKELTTNQAFAQHVQGLLNKIAYAEKSGDRAEVEGAVTNLIIQCRCNPGLLVPYFFPKYPDDEPMTLWSRPHTFAMMALSSNTSLVVQASRQVGKCLTGDTEINVRNTDGVAEKISMKNFFEDVKCANK